LRSPLSTILGLLNVAEMEKPDPATLPHLTRIREQVNKLDFVIKEILDYSMNARTDKQIEKIEFNDLIENVKRNLGPQAQVERVHITLSVSGDSDFHSDRARMEIILKNLISNSIKFQDTEKKQLLIEIKAEVNSSQATITCADNGIGIEEIHFTKIFDMFYRATEIAKGAGLGLYIVKEAVHKLGGSIKVSSELGTFTKFEMHIPNFVDYHKAEK
jgi:signal transduction histidine kinase